MNNDENIGKCNYCGEEDTPLCIDTGWCESCVDRYVGEQDKWSG